MFRQSTAIGEEVYSAIESIPELREYGGEVKQQVHQAGLDGGAIEALLASGAAMTDEQAVRTVAQGAD